MAITVTWDTKIINVPRADMTLIQSNPTEIREINVNTLRLILKGLEGEHEGMPFLDTHRHNTEVTLAGIVYARVFEIINGYTVTFEDGQYAVNTVGANHNVGDVTNVNQVSIRVNNSAGLISAPAIEYASFQNAVFIDDTLTTSGTAYDLGTPANPVGNVADALLIASVRGFVKLFIIGDITFTTGQDLTDFTVEGESALKSNIVVDPGAVVDGLEVSHCKLSGTLDSLSTLQICEIDGLNFFEGIIGDSAFTDSTMVLGGSATTHLINCHAFNPGTVGPTFDMGGSGRDFIAVGWSGNITITNCTANQIIDIGVNGGHITFDSTVTDGTLVIRGQGSYTDNSTGTTLDKADFISVPRIVDGILEEPSANHVLAGTVGGDLSAMKLEVSRILGLTQENYRLLDPIYDSNSNLTSATIKIYPTSGDVFADTNELAEYAVAATFNADSELQAYQVTKV